MKIRVLQPIDCHPVDAIIDHPDAIRLCESGAAEPADHEARFALDLHRRKQSFKLLSRQE